MSDELKGVAVADSDWDEDDWEGVWIERRFEIDPANAVANFDFILYEYCK